MEINRSGFTFLTYIFAFPVTNGSPPELGDLGGNKLIEAPSELENLGGNKLIESASKLGI